MSLSDQAKAPLRSLSQRELLIDALVVADAKLHDSVYTREWWADVADVLLALGIRRIDPDGNLSIRLGDIIAAIDAGSTPMREVRE